jgi:Flp pilus assembly protein TadD
MRNRVTTILLIVAVCAGCQPQHASTSAVKKQYNASTARTYLPLAEDQYKRGEYKAASESAAKVLEAAPQMPQAHVVLGKSLLALGQTAEAGSHFKTATELDATLGEAWVGMAMTAEAEGDSVTVRRYLETAAGCSDAAPEAMIHLADMYIASGESEKALALLEKHSQAGGQPEIMKAAAAANLRCGNTDRAVVIYERLCKESPMDHQLAEALAYAYIDAGRKTDAAHLFERLCQKSPAGLKGYVTAASGCYISEGSYDAAVTLCDRYASVCKDDAAFWLTMGRAALGKRDASRALYAAKRAIAIEPANAEGRILMGCAQYLDGQYTEAIDTFGAVSSDGNSFVWAMKGQCYDRLGDKAGAMAAFQRALAIDPANKKAIKYMADMGGSASPETSVTPDRDMQR